MPSTLIRNHGTTDVVSIVGNGAKNSFRLSNGNVLYVVMDRNQDATAGHGDNSNVGKAYVYERDTSTNIVTLRATIATGTIASITGALFSNNDLALVWVLPDTKTVRYAKMTYSTYSVSSTEAVYTLGGSFQYVASVDVDVSDDGAVLVGMLQTNYGSGFAAPAPNQGVYSILVVRNTANTWVANAIGFELFFSGFNFDTKYMSMGVVALGGTATARNVVSGATGRDTNNSTYQFTLRTSILNTTTGVLSSSTLRTTQTPLVYYAGTTSVTKLWRRTANDWVMGTAGSSGWYSMRGTWDGTTSTITSNWEGALWLGGSAAYGNAYSANWGFPAISYGGDKLNFYVLATVSPAGYEVGNVVVALDEDPAHVKTSYYEGKMNWPLDNVWGIGSSGNRNLSSSSHDVLAQYGGTGGTIVALYVKIPPYGGGSGITNLSPSTGTTVISAQPTLSGEIDTEVAIDFTRYKVEFQFAQNNTFTVALIDYVQPFSKFMEVNSTDQPGVTKSFSDTLPVSAGSLAAGVWYHRARLVNEFGQVGAWTTINNLTIGHPPVLVPTFPGGSRYFNYATGNVDLSWSFTDPSSTDYQTAYQIIVINELTGTTLVDTGKVTSSAKFATVTIPSGSKDALLSWQIRGWDSDNANGAYSEKAMFYLTDPPAVTITAPTNGSTVTTPRPLVTFGVVTSGGRTVSDATVTVYKAGVVVWAKKVVIGAGSGVSTSVRIDQGILTDGSTYTVQVRATDSGSLVGTSSLFTFTADWTPPAAPSTVAASAAHYNVEGEGYVSVTWTNATDDAAFLYYIVYRRDDLINPYSGAVVQAGTPKIVYTQYSSQAVSEFRDYSAPSNYQVNYLVHQVASSSGGEIESQNSTYTPLTISSDGYWLIETDISGSVLDSFKLHIVTGDAYTNEIQEEELDIIGRGRVFNRGDNLGAKGSLDAQLRDTGIYTARQKKQRIESLAERGSVLWMRNPFGDVISVNISQIAVTRIAGVGGAEFCDISIPYAEVGA